MSIDNNTKLPTGHFRRVHRMWAWVVSDEAGEGLLALQERNGSWRPLIGFDREMIESWRPAALEIGFRINRTIKLIVCGDRKTLETHAPPKEGNPTPPASGLIIPG